MASLLMHLYVGKKFVEQHKQIVNLSQFYLGCIIPDSVNADDCLASKDIRWAAHIRSGNIKEWYDNNIEFYRRSVKNVDNELLLGYVVHNITDAAFDDLLYTSLRDELKKANKPPVTNLGPRWDDCFRFDYDQRKELWWTNEVLPALKKAIPTEINGINKNLVDKFIKNITDEKNFTFPEGNPSVITIKMMDNLSYTVCKIVDDFINI